MKTLIPLFLGVFLCVGCFATFAWLSSIPTNFVPIEEVPQFYYAFFNFKYDPNQKVILYPTPTLLTNSIIGLCLITGFALIYKSVDKLEKTRPPEKPKPLPLPLQHLKPYLSATIILVSILLMTGIIHSLQYGNPIINLVVGFTIFLGVFGLHSMYKSLNARNEDRRWLVLFVATACLLIAFLTLETLL